MTEPTPPAICGARHESYPDTVCTEPPAHRMPHGGPLIIGGRECGGAAWGPDDGYADAPTELASPVARANENGQSVVPTPVPDPALVQRAAEALHAAGGPFTSTDPETLAVVVLAELAPELDHALQTAREAREWKWRAADAERRVRLQRERAERAEAALTALRAEQDKYEEEVVGRFNQQATNFARTAGLAEQRAEQAAAALDSARGAHRTLRAQLAAFQDVLDDTDRGPWANTVTASMDELATALDTPTQETP